jgi:hypothetical protein
MVEVRLSETLRDLRGALPVSATGEIKMPPYSAMQFLEALDILSMNARLLEEENEQLRWRLGAARDAVRNTAVAARRDHAEGGVLDTAAETIAAEEAAERAAERVSRLRKREAEIAGDVAAVRDGLKSGEVVVFPIVPRPAPRERPITEADMLAAMAAIARDIAPGAEIDVLEGDAPPLTDPLARDLAEDGA